MATANYATAPTDGQKGFADTNHVNLGLPYGAETFFVDPGVNISGRPYYEILTAAWYAARLQEAVAAMKTAHSARGEKIVVDATGQAKMLALVRMQNEIGERAKHFAEGQTTAATDPLTSADIAAQRITVRAANQIATGARVFVFNINFGRDPVVVPEAAA